MVFDRLTINVPDRTVKCENTDIDLTRKEYELLLYFVSNSKRVLTKQAIVEHLWGTDTCLGNYDFIYAHIKNLLRKLMTGGCPDYIRAVYGMGYKLFIPEEEKS